MPVRGPVSVAVGGADPGTSRSLPPGGGTLPPVRFLPRGLPPPPVPSNGPSGAGIAGRTLPGGPGGGAGPADRPGGLPRPVPRCLGGGSPPGAELPLSGPPERVGLQAAQPLPPLGGPGRGRGGPGPLVGPFPRGAGRSAGYPHGPAGAMAGDDPQDLGGLEDRRGDHPGASVGLPGGSGPVRFSADPGRNSRRMHLPASGAVRRMPAGPCLRRFRAGRGPPAGGFCCCRPSPAGIDLEDDPTTGRSGVKDGG